MRLRFIVLFVFILLTQNTIAQSEDDTKTLIQKLQKASIQQQKAELIIQICDHFAAFSQTDSIKKYILFATPFIHLLPNESTKAWIEHYLATTIVRVFPDSSLQLSTRSLRFFSLQNDQKGLARVNHALGVYQYYHGKPSKERAYYMEALKYTESYYKIYEPKRYTRFRAVIYNNIANSYLDENQSEKALECINEVEKTAIESQSDELAYLAANGFGYIYSKTKQLEKSKLYFQEALKYAEKLNKLPYIAICLNNLGTYYTLTKKNDEAIKMYKKALNIAYKMNDWMGVANRLNNLGSIESVQENHTVAEKYFLQSIEYADKLKNRKLRLNAMANLARIYLQMERVVEAQKIAQEAIVIAEELNERDVLSKLYNTLMKSYEKQKDFSKALIYQQRKSKMQDSVLNLSSLSKIQELQARYESEKKEYQIRELNRQNQIQALELQEQNLWFALLGVILFGMVLVMSFYARQHILIQKNQVLSMNQKLLRTQINPHFFFNVLSSIQVYLLEKQDAVAVVSYLSKFSKLMRSVLENSRVEFISLSEEINTLQNYLDIQKIRFEGKFDYEIHVEESINAQALGIPPMLAQPFLENALEHGLKMLGEKGEIEVSFQSTKKKLVLRIKDNGVGRIQAAQQSTDAGYQSLSTQITKERLWVLNQQLKTKIDFHIEDVLDSKNQVAGTQITFYLPLIQV